MIFQLEHLSLVQNTVKHIHFQNHRQEINALYQSCIIYLHFFYLADLNGLGTNLPSGVAIYFCLLILWIKTG